MVYVISYALWGMLPAFAAAVEMISDDQAFKGHSMSYVLLIAFLAWPIVSIVVLWNILKQFNTKKM